MKVEDQKDFSKVEKMGIFRYLCDQGTGGGTLAIDYISTQNEHIYEKR